MEDKKILVIGYGKAGKTVAMSMLKKSWQVFVYDDFLKNISEKDLDKRINFIYNSSDVISQEFDLLVKSPGIKPTNPLILALKKQGRKIISDIELGYLFKGPEKLIGITGTNGKTTTTSFIEFFLNKNNIKAKAVGNIGLGAVEEMIFTKMDILAIECSSFQLNDIETFRPDIALITNIDKDHLDYHGSEENYIRAKLNLLKNLGPENYAVLNYDDPILKNQEGPYKKIYFSSKNKLTHGFYYKDGYIIFAKNQVEEKLIDCKQLKLKGIHNYENIMAGLGVFYSLGLNLKDVSKTAYEFSGVRHRLEFVRNFKGVDYYNDSKGTNTDSTRKALASFSQPIIILMGGYDKGEDFSGLLKEAKDKIKALLAFGQTGEKIYETARDQGYQNIFLAHDLKGAFTRAQTLACSNDLVLLSPACASWDQYKSFEDRGDEFVNLVNSLK
ncbi:UDP-N-acetylmuramoyl-L-alanine--D-glutamate ligase [Neofamilia massiliensis]|uniref:UDP-N-acetylmuramoyl-L-alanine--D-glutamate ligase n=1 Tax=Neofamilia massiliensis TaxID=1673724 RepID=UPI0006BB8BDB|nr:UDP-N-acetylmuramoyl-L-alanine--D-glutamate ligase [Neofamilia massiliensis]